MADAASTTRRGNKAAGRSVLKSYRLDGHATFVPNERYGGPNKPHLAEFREIPMESDDAEFALLRKGPDGPGAVQVGFAYACRV